MAKLGDAFARLIEVGKFRQKFVVADLVERSARATHTRRQQALMVKRLQNTPAVLQRTQAVEADRVHALEDVIALAMPGRMAMLLHKSLDFLEPGNDPLLTWRSANTLVRRLEFREFLGQFVEVDISHTGLPS